MRLLLRPYLLLRDALEVLTGPRGGPLPPRRNVGGPYLFRKNGRLLLGAFREAGLRPDNDILDVGCGWGRTAIPLMHSLHGSYRGFDIDAEAIDWCREHIPQFRFDVADAQRRFPFADDSFDFVTVVGVFTHLEMEGIELALPEIARVMKPGGGCFATFYLTPEDPRYTVPPERLRLVTAIDEPVLRTLYTKCGLSIPSIRYGSWCGRKAPFGQDIIVARAPR